MKVRFNAPFTFFYAFLIVLIFFLNQYVTPGLIGRFFSVPGKGGANWTSPILLMQTVAYVVGHTSWAHLTSNIMMILLLGPPVESRYGSVMMAIMVILTAAVGGVINLLFFPAPLVGASGIVFMLVVLVSFAGMDDDEFPVSVLIVFSIFVAREVIAFHTSGRVSHTAHIEGAVLGGLYGYLGQMMKSALAARHHTR